MNDRWESVVLGSVAATCKRTVAVEDGVSYPAAGVMMEGRGLIDRQPFVGGVSGYKKLTPISPGQLVLRSITAWEAPITVVPDGYEGRHVSGVFPVFDLDQTRILPSYMRLICQWPSFWNEMRIRVTGTVLRRKTLNSEQLLQVPVELPPLPEQRRIVDLILSVDSYIDALQRQADATREARDAVLRGLLFSGGEDWTRTRLGDIAEAGWGNTTVTKQRYRDSGYTAFSASGPDGLLEWFEHDGKGVVLSAIGALCGKTWLADGRWTPIKNTIWFKSISDSCLTEFLFLLSKTPSLWPIRGQAQPFIALGDVRLVEVPLPPIREQERMVEVMSSIEEVVNSADRAIAAARYLRSGLLSDLLSGEHEIPESYDRLLGAA